MKNETYIQKFLEGRARYDLCIEQQRKAPNAELRNYWVALAEEELKKSDAWREKLYKKLRMQGMEIPHTKPAKKEKSA